MIPILYEANLSNAGILTNGICRLADCTSCVVTEERNGEFTLSLKMPVQGRYAAELKVDRIIKAAANDTSQPQCFRIVRVDKNMKHMQLEVLANHISYDMSFIPVRPFSATVTGRHEAFARLWENTLEDNLFSFVAPEDTLIKKLGPNKPTSLRAMLGGVEGSILDLFGGEYEFDNRNVIWHLHRGEDRGVVIRYGKNLTSYEQEENIAETICGIIPYFSLEDTVIYGDIQYCANANNYAIKRTVPYDFTMSFDDGQAPSVEALNAKARAYIEENEIGIPDVSMRIEFRQLWDTPEYKHLRGLEHVSLCDTVSVYFPQLAVTAKAKVVKTEYDCLLDRYNFIELGSARKDISARIAAVSEQLSKSVQQKELRIYQNEVSALLADKISTNVFTAYQATVTSLLADKANITDLTAYEAQVTILLADKASVDELRAVEASISNLDVKYAQIDFANVDTALISAGFAKQFLVSQGMIADAVTAETAQITGYLTGVGIVANSIKTGTLDAGNITVTNLNCASLTVGQINGQQIASGAVSLSNLASDASNAISTAASDASEAKTAAQQCIQLIDGKAAVFYQASAPTGGVYNKNDIWFDTGNGNKMYRWDGTSWIAQGFGESALAAGSVSADKIAAGAVVAAAIASGAITSDKIAANTITASNLAAGAITSDKIAANTIKAGNIASGTITTTQIASGTIIGTNIAGETITGDKLVANTITASKIASGTITSNEIAANTITAGNIAAGTITSTQIAAGTITAANLASDVLTVGNISDFLPAVQAAMDGIDIGGRNLVRKTLTPRITQNNSTWPNLNGVAYLGGTTGTRYAVEHGMGVVNTDARWTRFYFGTSNLETASLLGLIPGQSYTWSCDVRWKQVSAATDSATRYMRAQLYENAGTPGSFHTTHMLNFGTITPEQRGTIMSARCEFTFTVSEESSMLFMAIQCSDTTDSHYAAGDFIELANIKIEKGNKATDWTPAPEDVEMITDINDVIADWCYNNDTTYINGGKIYTGTITAEKISVSDLKAFGATIGGIQITDNSIKSSNGKFSVTSSGVLTATGAVLNGTLTTVSGEYKLELATGGMNVYYNNTWYGRFMGTFWTSSPTKRGIAMSARPAASYLFFGKYDDAADVYTSSYIINFDLNPSGYTERHIFYSTSRFLSTVHVEGPIILNNNYAYKGIDLDGNAVGLIWMSNANNICVYDPNHDLYLGHTSRATGLRGSTITVSGAATFGSTATFNNGMVSKASLTFASGYGIKVTDTKGNVSYAFAINTSDQITLTNTSLDVFVYGKSTYIGSNGTSLYLRGTIGAYATFANATGIKINNKAGTAQTVLYLNSSDQICLVNTGIDMFIYGKSTYIGGTSTPTYIRGSTIQIGGRTAETLYKAGDTVSVAAYVYGWITNSQTQLILVIPMTRGIESGTTVTCTSATAAYLRAVNGTYVAGSNSTLTSYITSTTIRTCGLQVLLTKLEGWGVTNNTPVAGTISLKFTIAKS